eukprot:389123_1
MAACYYCSTNMDDNIVIRGSRELRREMQEKETRRSHEHHNKPSLARRKSVDGNTAIRTHITQGHKTNEARQHLDVTNDIRMQIMEKEKRRLARLKRRHLSDLDPALLEQHMTSVVEMDR